MELVVERPSNSRRAATPEVEAERAEKAAVTTAEREWLTELREEVDGYFESVQDFASSDPAHVMATISAIHARMSHIRIQLHRSGSQRAKSVRTQEVDPLIEALEFQFKVHSRLVSLAEAEWKMAGGAS